MLTTKNTAEVREILIKSGLINDFQINEHGFSVLFEGTDIKLEITAENNKLNYDLIKFDDISDNLSFVYNLEGAVRKLTEDKIAVCVSDEMEDAELFLVDGEVYCEEPNGISYVLTDFNDDTNSKWIIKDKS